MTEPKDWPQGANPQPQAFSRDVLKLDPAQETERIVAALREQVFTRLKRRGAVVGVSGGIDSAVSVSLCVRAFGAKRVLALFMPEQDSSDESQHFGELLTRQLGIPSILENIGPILEAADCYRRRDEAIRSVVPDYGPGYKSKIVLPGLSDAAQYAVFSIVVRSPQGEETKTRLTAEAYLGIVAATNFKQRTRKMMEYYHADRLNYAVAGTPNRLEYDQGFFVKNGDGAADFKPIAHLYKAQVYQLAEYLGVPEEIRSRAPTTDTYSLEQSQDEFYFSLPLDKFDLCLYGRNHDVSPAVVAETIGLSVVQVERAYQQIDSKRTATRYMHAAPLLVEKIKEIAVD